MRLHSYVVAHDTGFAPNPFWGFCTLATCKPVIRRTATIGDWVVGISPKRRGNRVVFAMLVDEILDYVSYYRDHRFACKIPVYSKNGVIWKAGDNIYKPLANGTFRQLRSMHSRGERENPQTKAHDLSGENILIAKKFHYFGASGPELPLHLTALKVGRAHKNHFTPETIANFVNFIANFPAGLISKPTHWPATDKSWQRVISDETGTQ
ncbi:MAG: hypothetical protein N839_0010695 [Desulfofustis sp. PB-SRB1]|mgnify:CR=1 FL=1|jgi:hypothetical protein|nr:hypothetical protein [Desulfofustis sp. PB-SRB1]MBM1002869.1 hypothetical protein [Desulfofustis sp. PB-SRB1]HBH28492.1 hypothetical protein [Desulfofustis sp.]